MEFAAHKDMQFGVSLYNRKVLIKSHCKELLPHYLRFLVGVVDSEDIPLNLSREMLQTDLIMEWVILLSVTLTMTTNSKRKALLLINIYFFTNLYGF